MKQQLLRPRQLHKSVQTLEQQQYPTTYPMPPTTHALSINSRLETNYSSRSAAPLSLEFPAFCTLPDEDKDSLFHRLMPSLAAGPRKNFTQREMSDVTVRWRRGVSVVTIWRSRKTDTGVDTWPRRRAPGLQYKSWIIPIWQEARFDV